MPVATFYAMGLKKPDLIPVRMKMSGAGADDLGIIGAIVLDIKTEDGRGNELKTKQFTYVATRVSRVFLSRQAMEDLRIVNKDFPRPMAEDETIGCIGNDVVDGECCDCPKRVTDPPRMPTELPEGFNGRDEEVPRLKDWLLNHYSASVFNICEHQPLPKMSGPPLRLHMDPEVLPVAVHKTASVPIHWRDKDSSRL